jgi:hypothetical protein
MDESGVVFLEGIVSYGRVNEVGMRTSRWSSSSDVTDCEDEEKNRDERE